MHHADIICLLTRAGLTLTDIASEEGVRVSSVSEVIHGKMTSHSIASTIATKVNRSVNTLWPGRYKHEPRPLRRPSKTKRRQAA